VLKQSRSCSECPISQPLFWCRSKSKDQRYYILSHAWTLGLATASGDFAFGKRLPRATEGGGALAHSYAARALRGHYGAPPQRLPAFATGGAPGESLRTPDPRPRHARATRRTAVSTKHAFAIRFCKHGLDAQKAR
jgi:hypothetical protein